MTVARKKPVPFEEMKFCQFGTLAARWDCSTIRLIELCSKGVLRAWHPEGKAHAKGRLIEVAGVLKAEAAGFIEIEAGSFDDDEGER